MQRKSVAARGKSLAYQLSLCTPLLAESLDRYQSTCSRPTIDLLEAALPPSVRGGESCIRKKARAAAK